MFSLRHFRTRLMCDDEPSDSWMMAVINVENINEHCQNVFKTEESVNITPSVEVEAIDFFDVEKTKKSDNNNVVLVLKLGSRAKGLFIT